MSTRAGLAAIATGAAACAACCAGPVIGFLAATGIASVLGAVVFGVVGVIVVLAVAAAVWYRRRQRQCAPSSTPVSVAPPRLRVPR